MVPTAKTARFDLAALAEGAMPELRSAHGAQLAQAAAVCLEYREHKSGVTFDLAGILSGLRSEELTVSFVQKSGKIHLTRIRPVEPD